MSLLRHSLATLAYRASAALRNAPPDFGSTTAGAGTRSALAILAHMGDLCEWSLSLVQGQERWRETPPGTFAETELRFFAALEALDREIAADPPAPELAARLLQGPIADALTHVGQLALLRRVAGAPMRGENYFAATITIGRAGRDQAPPTRPF